MPAVSVATLVLVGAFQMIYFVSQRLDRALYAGHDPKLVIAGKIVDRVIKADLERPDASLRFVVEQVIAGDAALIGQVIPLSVASFEWPRNLVPFEAGAACILVLRRESNQPDRIYSVVPKVSAVVPRASDSADLIRILGRELLAALGTEHAPKRQRALLLQLGPILSASDADAVAVHTHSPDVWVRRAALGALVYATASAPYLRMAATDIQQFLAATGPNDLLDGIEPSRRYAPYPFFYQHYFFLERREWTFGSRWTEADAIRNLGLFRALIKEGILSKAVIHLIDPDGAAAKP